LGKRPIISIDGPASSGKSTTARELAKKLGYLWLDTGAMYRALAWKALQERTNPEDKESLIQLARQTRIKLIPRGSGYQISVDGKEVGEEIRTEEVGNLASSLSQIKEIREIMVKEQRRIGKKGGVVAEGRDIGTVVFPKAKIKIFLTASLEERAKRRWKELKEKGREVKLEEIKKELGERDKRDTQREFAPLKRAPGAVIVDNTSLSLSETLERILKLVEERKIKTPLWYLVLWGLSWFIFRVFFLLKIEGKENLPCSGGFILSSNHLSYLDPILLGLLLPRKMNFMAKEELFRGAFGWFIQKLGAFPLKRGKLDPRGYKRALNILKKGEILALFPEGTRSFNGKLGPLQKGAAGLSIRCGVPLVPVIIKGTEKALPRGAHFIKLAKLKVKVGEPLFPSGGEKEEELHRRLEERLKTLWRELNQ